MKDIITTATDTVAAVAQHVPEVAPTTEHAAIIALVIFTISYIFIATEKIPKVLAAFGGAGALMLLKVLPQEYAYAHIDLTVISLLFSMMIIVKTAEKSGMFEYMAIWSAKKANGDPRIMLFSFIVLTAVMSAFLDNVTTVLLVGPISIFIAKQLKISPLPFIISEIFASNIGGTATLIGDPPNLMIGSAAHLTFSDFLVNLAPIIFIELVVLAFSLIFLFRKTMVVSNKAKAMVMEMDPKKAINDPTLLHKSIIVLAAVISGFLIHGYIDLESDTIALSGAIILLVWAKVDVEEALKEVEWSTLMFFAGLFILVSSLEFTGVLEVIAEKFLASTEGNLEGASMMLIWASGILSGILDNIPLVATLIPVIKIAGTTLGEHAIHPLWWSLSLGSCLGGNGTVIGASANVLMVDMAKKNNIPISFTSFLKYSIPITLVSLAMAAIYVHFKYF